MNKFIFVFALIILSTLASAGTEDVMFKLKLEYDPHIDTSCTTNVTGTGNETVTTENCTSQSNGVIKVTGGEDESHVMIVENLLDIIPGRIYTGYKTADLGNLSDITGINDKLDAFSTCSDKLNACMDSNRNVSSQLILLQEDHGVKANFTECSALLVQANANLETRQAELKLKNEEIDSLKSGKFIWIILGGILGAVVVTVVIPKLKGTDVPKDSVGRDHPPNPGV